MSDSTQPSLNGITDHAMTASTKEIIGARKKTKRSAPAGTTTSLTIYLMKSANDWSRPKAPTTFGPLRICTAAQTLRSAYIKNASASKSGIRTSKHCPRIVSTIPVFVVVKNSYICRSPTSATPLVSRADGNPRRSLRRRLFFRPAAGLARWCKQHPRARFQPFRQPKCEHVA